MSKYERIQKLDQILKQCRYPISEESIAEKLECSRKTVQRYIACLQNEHGAPLIKVKDQGWKYNKSGECFELPGIWLNSKELIGFSTILKLMNGISSNLMKEDVAYFRAQLKKLLSNHHLDIHKIEEKIKIIPTLQQYNHSKTFENVLGGLVQNKRLYLSYIDYQGQESEREVSPLQIIYYQENWYCDCYCHLRKALRQFKLSNIQSARVLSETIKEVDQKILDQHFSTSYGIFAGKPNSKVKLRFMGSAAREAASRQWHPEQEAQWQDNDYLLTFPFNDDRELIRDILKYANCVEVLAPAKLKNKIKCIAMSVLDLYQ